MSIWSRMRVGRRLRKNDKYEYWGHEYWGQSKNSSSVPVERRMQVPRAVYFGGRWRMRSLCLILTVSLLVACSDDPTVVHRPGEPAVINFDAEDPEMNAAMQNARSSFADFAQRLPSLREAGSYFSVKVPVTGDAGTEHIWLTDPEVHDGQVRGRLGNNPLSGPHKFGDIVEVPDDAISDWMAVIEGDLYGGFTVLVARSRMSEAERMDFDQSVDFRVPPTAREF